MADDMKTVIRGTTVSPVVEVEGVDLTALNVHLSFTAGVLIVKASERGELTVEYDDTAEPTFSTVTARLTQDDTLAMKTGICELQVRAFNADGTEALATRCGRFSVGKVNEDGKLGGAQ